MKATGFSRVSKNLIIAEVEKELKDRKIFFVVQHGRTPASSMDKLRAKLRASRSRYVAIKQSLGKIALEKALMKTLSERLKGTCGFVFAGGDPAPPSKTLVDFARENQEFKIEAGFMNGSVLTADQIKVLASLPPREVLLARVLGGMQAPVSKFVGVLSGTVRKIVTVIDAIAKKKVRH
ncbi:MAG: 50S ribosomal protein L10 [Omnitrophica bacterium RIFCSPHIGHO2_02_FULL_51_18]|nr:MAG: 50S ribosomal protein L10 [Omnitrophica bacterium RIFCSPHIGHO2_02_FULL_51_18]